MMKNILKPILGMSLLSLSLFALDAPLTLSIDSPSNGKSIYGDEAVSFDWSGVSGATQYYYVCDQNSTTTPYNSDTKKQTTNTQGSCTPTASGTWYIHVQAYDGSTTYSDVTRKNIAVDVDDPVLAINKAINDNGTVSITMDSTDPANSSTSIYFTTDGTTPSTSSSEYSSELTFAVGATVKALAVDAGGNSAVDEEVFTISGNNPTLKTSDTTDLAGQVFATVNTNGATPKTQLTVGGAGFTKYKYKFSTDSAYSALTTISEVINIATKTTSGTYTIYLLGADNYNTQSETAKSEFTFTIDNTKPANLTSTTTINSVSSTTKTSLNDNFTFTLSGTDNKDNSLSYYYTLDGGNPKDTGINASSATTTKTVASGNTQSFTLQFAAKDDAGNWSDTKSITYSIDKVEPTITMPEAISFSDYFDTTLTMSEDGSIYYNLEQVDGTTCSTTKTIQNIDDNLYDGSSLTVAKATSETVTQSNFCLYAKAVDEATNESAVASTLFTYNSSAITLNLTGITSGSSIATVNTYGATAKTTLAIDGSNIDKYDYQIDANGLVSDNTWSSASVISIASLDEGEHNISVSAYDTDKTMESNKTITFTIDNTKPTTIVINDTNFTTTTTVSLTLPTDAVSVYYALSDGETPATYTVLDGEELEITQTKTLWVKTRDSAGNYSDVTTALYTKSAQTTTLDITQGWSMISLPVSGTFEASSLFDTVEIAWKYNQDTNWTVYSMVNSDLVLATSYTPFSSVTAGEGVWVYAKTEQNIDINATTTFSIIASQKLTAATTGWHLIGTASQLTPEAIFAQNSSASLIWYYNTVEKKWYAKTTNATTNTTISSSTSFGLLTTLPANSAFWIKVD